MKKTLKEAASMAAFGALVFTLVLVVFNLYAARVGAPTMW